MPVWHLPAELQTPVPRAAMVTFSAKLAGVSVFSVVTMMSVLLVVLGASVSMSRASMKWHGVDASGQVTRVFVTYSRGNPSYNVAYRYTPTGAAAVPNRDYHGEGTVTLLDYEALQAGAPLTVIYDPRSPSRSMPNPQDVVRTTDPALQLERVAMLAGSLFGVGCLVTLFLFLRFWKDRDLLTFGKAAPATILSEKADRNKSRRVSKVTYQFLDASGTAIRGVRKGGGRWKPSRARTIL
jgi:hypothetical protein